MKMYNDLCESDVNQLGKGIWFVYGCIGFKLCLNYVIVCEVNMKKI